MRKKLGRRAGETSAFRYWGSIQDGDGRCCRGSRRRGERRGGRRNTHLLWGWVVDRARLLKRDLNESGEVEEGRSVELKRGRRRRRRSGSRDGCDLSEGKEKEKKKKRTGYCGEKRETGSCIQEK